MANRTFKQVAYNCIVFDMKRCCAKKWEVRAMHHLENKPGMLLCCLLKKSLFHIKSVVHFPKALICCGFCRLLFLNPMSRKGMDGVNL